MRKINNFTFYNGRGFILRLFCFSIAEIKAGTFIENIFDVGNEYYTKHKTYLFNITVIYGYG